MVTLTVRLPSCSFSGHRTARSTSGVFGAGNWFQMIRVTATSVSTEMINMKPIRNRTDKEFPGIPVRSDVLSVDVKYAVSSAISAFDPLPAIPTRIDP